MTDILNDTFPPTDRTTHKRLSKRGSYDRALVHAILDEGYVAHVGFAAEGRPFVLPMAYARLGDVLYLHGAAASRLLRTLEAVEACVTVTHLDGLVLARSAFHHSMNYRSVMVFGQATLVTDEAEKTAALRALTEHVWRDRWDAVRPPTPAELAGTKVLAVPLVEASAKVRTGPPVDDEPDHALPVWAGQVPLALTRGTPIPDERCLPGTSL